MGSTNALAIAETEKPAGPLNSHKPNEERTKEQTTFAVII